MAKKKVSQSSREKVSSQKQTSSPMSVENGSIQALIGMMGDPWRDHPETIRQFLEQLEAYERLCDEVAYTLRNQLDAKGIQYAAVTQRAKSLASFLEKIKRKSYEAPFEQITDFAAARVVCLYQDDLPQIEAIIRHEFNVHEKVDKLNDKADDQFGYGAIHFVVTLGSSSVGARYNTISQLKCEIQTRTVLQDAWAIIQHHMVYKHEKEVPSAIKRGLNGLAGLLEVADEQYMQLRLKHKRYVAEIESKKLEEFLDVELNVDSLREYMARKFPSLPAEGYDPEKIYQSLQECETLRDLNDLVDQTAEVRNSCFAALGSSPTRESSLLFSVVIWWIQKVRSLGWDEEYAKARIMEQNPSLRPAILDLILKMLRLMS